MIDDISLADNSGESVNPTADSTFGTDSGAESNAESNAESIAEPTQDSSTGTVDRGFDVNHPMVPTAAVLSAFDSLPEDARADLARFIHGSQELYKKHYAETVASFNQAFPTAEDSAQEEATGYDVGESANESADEYAIGYDPADYGFDADTDAATRDYLSKVLPDVLGIDLAEIKSLIAERQEAKMAAHRDAVVAEYGPAIIAQVAQETGGWTPDPAKVAAALKWGSELPPQLRPTKYGELLKAFDPDGYHEAMMARQLKGPELPSGLTTPATAPDLTPGSGAIFAAAERMF